MSLPEVLLWGRLRESDIRFRRQHPIGPYVTDFYNAATRLVVEVDGGVHDAEDRQARDDERERFLVENGYRVIRVIAADILRAADEVAASIVAFAARPLHQPAAGPPPRSGEDLS